MNKYSYRVFYKYNGPSHSDPFRSPKNSNEIFEALNNFPNELPYYLLSDQEATISNEKDNNADSIIVYISTTLDEKSIDKAVEQCLNGLGLFGKKLNMTSL